VGEAAPGIGETGTVVAAGEGDVELNTNLLAFGVTGPAVAGTRAAPEERGDGSEPNEKEFGDADDVAATTGVECVGEAARGEGESIGLEGERDMMLVSSSSERKSVPPERERWCERASVSAR